MSICLQRSERVTRLIWYQKLRWNWKKELHSNLAITDEIFFQIHWQDQLIIAEPTHHLFSL